MSVLTTTEKSGYDAAVTKLSPYPTASGLTTGQCLRATGAATCAFGALDLANSSAVTGALPIANVAAGFTKSDGSVAFTGDQSMGSHKITNVTDPASAQDAATKNYGDTRTHAITGWGDSANSGINADRFYNWNSSLSLTSATENISNFAAPFACTATGIMHNQNASLSTDTVTDTLRINGVDSAVTLVLAAGTTSNSATGFSVAIAFGDILTVKGRQNGTNAAASQRPRVSILYRSAA